METFRYDMQSLVVLALHSPIETPGYKKCKLFFPEKAEQKLTLS